MGAAVDKDFLKSFICGGSSEVDFMLRNAEF